MTKFTKRLIQLFLILGILFFLGFYYIIIADKLIPAFKKDDQSVSEINAHYQVSEIRLYMNKHEKIDEEPSAYTFQLLRSEDHIAYAKSASTTELDETPQVIAFSSVLPQEMSNDEFYLSYFNNDKELSRFPSFKFSDLIKQVGPSTGLRTVEIKQQSSDGKMMLFLIVNLQYDY